MLRGEFQHTLDAKFRIILPARLRTDLGEKFVLTKGFDRCLYAYPMEEWAVFEAKLLALPVANKEARQVTRFFLSRAVDCDVDKQGRVVIPQTLREFAELEKDVVTIGVGNRAEIWSKTNWADYCKESDYISEDLEAAMARFNI